KPAVEQLIAEPGLRVALFSDGIIHAGERYRRPFDPLAYANTYLTEGLTAQEFADLLIAEALATDQGRPEDDMTVVALVLRPRGEYPPVRRLSAVVPLP